MWDWGGVGAMIGWFYVLFPAKVAPPVGRARGWNVPKCDRTAAHADVVGSCGSADSARLGATLSSPTRPRALFPSPFRRFLWPVAVPSRHIQLCKGLGNSQLMLGWLNVDIMYLKKNVPFKKLSHNI